MQLYTTYAKKRREQSVVSFRLQEIRWTNGNIRDVAEMRVCLSHADGFGDNGSHYPVDVVDCCSTRIARKTMQTLKYEQARAAVRSNSGSPHERSSMPHAGTSFGEITM